MAIDAHVMGLLKPFLSGARMWSLSYPDIIVSSDVVESLLGVRSTKFSDAGRFHKKDFPLPETDHVLKAAGAVEIVYTDFKALRGIEQVIDLNLPVPFLERFDLVLNPGTIEHCFNVWRAWKNSWEALVAGGVIVHVAPLAMINHGFWSMNPTLYEDFAEVNGGAVLDMFSFTTKGESVPIDRRKRCTSVNNSVLYCAMRRKEIVPFCNPIQWKYNGLG